MARQKRKEIDHKWVRNNNGSISIVFSYQGKPYKFAPVRRGKISSDQDRAIASQIARAIELEIKLGKFEGIERWSQKKSKVNPENPLKELSLKEVWEYYKTAKADKVSPASQVSVWCQTDRCLDCLKSLPQDINKISLKSVVEALQKKYGNQVIDRTLSDLHAACNLAKKRTLIPSNPLAGYRDYLPPTPKSNRSKACYSNLEVLVILEAFKAQEAENINHYQYFVEFLFLTGVRPQLAIALTWQDIKPDKIIFDKGFTNGVKTPGKTGRVTHYPIFPQLEDLIKRIFQSNKSDEFGLVFPSHKKGYISLHSFTKDTWKPVITKLVESKRLSKYLPTYHCRHSTATLLAKAGLPSSTIAALLDTSEKMLNKHYLDTQELTKVVIPDLLAKRMDVTGLEPVTPTMST